MSNVWDRQPKHEDPYREAWKGEWGWFGKLRFEFHRERMARAAHREMAKLHHPEDRYHWKQSQRPFGVRRLIFGFLLVEGIVAFVIGAALMAVYWPPIIDGKMGNGIAFCGLGVVGASISYTFFVAAGIRLYNLLNPLPKRESSQQPAADE